jgi:hypothetical protein
MGYEIAQHWIGNDITGVITATSRLTTVQDPCETFAMISAHLSPPSPLPMLVCRTPLDHVEVVRGQCTPDS